MKFLTHQDTLSFGKKDISLHMVITNKVTGEVLVDKPAHSLVWGFLFSLFVNGLGRQKFHTGTTIIGVPASDQRDGHCWQLADPTDPAAVTAMLEAGFAGANGTEAQVLLTDRYPGFRGATSNPTPHQGENGVFEYTLRNVLTYTRNVGAPDRIKLQGAGTTEYSSSITFYFKVVMVGLETATNVNGLKILNFAQTADGGSNHEYDVYNLDGTDFTADVDPTLGPTACTLRLGDLTYNPTTSSSFRQLSNASIIVGTGTDPVKITDTHLKHYIPRGITDKKLAHSGIAISTPTVGATTSEINISRDFTNNSGADIQVNEIGMLTYMGVNVSQTSYMNLIARDLVSFIIAPTETVNVAYKLRTTTPTTGGFLIQFNEMMYRNLALANREAKDIFNRNIFQQDCEIPMSFVSWCSNTLWAQSLSQTSPNMPYYYGDFIGPQVGTSSDNVVNTNFRLQNDLGDDTRIPHGKGAGKLYYHPSTMSRIIIDPINDKCYMDVIRLFENLSGGDITIRETGLYAFCAKTQSTTGVSGVHAISRNVLAVPIVLPNNNILKLTQRVQLEIIPPP